MSGLLNSTYPRSRSSLAYPTEERIIRPARNILGSLRLPGDKSISHRYGMLAAFAEGTSRFTNFSTGADCASTLACMEALGAQVNRLDRRRGGGHRRRRPRNARRAARSTAATPARPCA